jgi:hypothetical protein
VLAAFEPIHGFGTARVRMGAEDLLWGCGETRVTRETIKILTRVKLSAILREPFRTYILNKHSNWLSGGTMSDRERRTSPRKECTVPLRFRVLANGKNHHAESVRATYETRGAKTSGYFEAIEGEAVNLSERGIYFRSREEVKVGEPIEMYLTLPRELTGRSPEEVRCSARVVHVESRADQLGMRGVGAAVERFEPLVAARNWGN